MGRMSNGKSLHTLGVGRSTVFSVSATVSFAFCTLLACVGLAHAQTYGQGSDESTLALRVGHSTVLCVSVPLFVRAMCCQLLVWLLRTHEICADMRQNVAACLESRSPTSCSPLHLCSSDARFASFLVCLAEFSLSI